MAKKFSVWWIVLFGICLLFSTVIVFFKSQKVESDSRINIVCSTFPVYDWTSHILGDDSNTIVLSMTEKNGVNYHSYIPSETDLDQIKKNRLFICIGTEGKLMEAAENSASDILNLGECAGRISKKEYEIDADHIWLSVKNAEVFSEEIKKAIISLDPANQEKYENNLNKYLNQLKSLDDEYSEFFCGENLKPVILCDRNPFIWLFDDYNVKFYSAMENCNSDNITSSGLEKTADENTIHYLTEKMDENNLKVLFKLENSSDKFAHLVIKDSKNPLGDILTLDSMHAVTLNEAFKGKSYVKVMRSNLEEMKKTAQN